jgi:hypothetical protein
MSNDNIDFSLSSSDLDDCGYEAFTDFSWRVCEGCLTPTEHRDFQNNMGVTA